MKRILIWILGVGVIATLFAAIFFRLAVDEPDRWHVDPLTAERTGKPNDFIVAPEGLSTATPDRVFGARSGTPKELLFQFDAVASQSATRLAGSLEDLHITYVQRTPVMGFPDYISVKAIEVEGGAALAIYSRSRYGRSDFDANRMRINGWLAQIGGN